MAIGAVYEYLIQYTTDLKGIARAKGELRKLDAYNRKFGKNVGRVSQVLSKNISHSTKQIVGGATQTTRNIQRTFRTASGEMYTYGRAVTTSGGKVVRTTDKLRKGMAGATKATQGMSRGMAMIAMRAMKTIPVWLVLRAAMMGIMNVVSSTFKAWTELSSEMGRVAGVTRGTQQDVDGLKDAIIDFSRTSSRGFKEVASVVYALGSAGLKVTEQMAGFEHIMDVTIGTFGDAEQIAKLTAGAYNVFGESLENAYTVSKKFKDLSDILAYTYSTQQVELSEVATAMTYVASIGSLLNISFEHLVGTIGFLNTGMLKGSKSGTALMNAFIKLAVSGDKLAKLGVVFDPSQPLDLLDVMEQLYNIYGKQAMSLDNLRELMDVFGRRGGRAAAQMIDSYERWRRTLNNTRKNFKDFAEEMAEKAENTLPGAWKKFGNAFKANFIDKLKESEGPIKRWLNSMTEANEKVFRMRKMAKLGIIAPYVTGPLKTPMYRKEDIEFVEEFYEEYKGVVDVLERIKAGETDVSEKIKTKITFQEKLNELAKKRVEGLIDDVQLETQLNGLAAELAVKAKLNVEQTKELFKWTKDQIKISKTEVKNVIGMTKARKEQLRDIKRAGEYQLMATVGIEEGAIQAAKMANLQKDINEKIDEQNNRRQELLKTGKETNLTHLENVSIQDLLSGKYKDLEAAARSITSVEKKANKIRKLRIGIEDQLLSKKREQLNTVTNLVVQYGKADMFEKGRVRRALELMGKAPETLADLFRTRAFDRDIILDFWNIFEKDSQEKITQMAVRMWGLSDTISNLGDLFSKEFELPKEDIKEYANTWLNSMNIAADSFGEHFKATLIAATGEMYQIPSVKTELPTGVTFPQIEREEPKAWLRPTERKIYIKDVEGKTFGADTLEKLERLIETYREEQNKTREKMDDLIEAQRETTSINKAAF